MGCGVSSVLQEMPAQTLGLCPAVGLQGWAGSGKGRDVSS